MKTFRGSVKLATALLLLWPVTTFAQESDKAVAMIRNHTSATAVHLIPGQSPARADVGGANPERWFDFQGKSGRSYCVEVTSHEVETAGSDPKVTVLSDLGAVVASNDDVFDEPDALLESRACFIAPTTTGSFIDIKVENFSASSTVFVYYVRVVDTTLFNSWFYADQNYFSYSLLRNTTNVTISVTITWRSQGGGVFATSSQTVPPNGAIGPEVGSFVTVGTGISGAVEVAHNGSPDALTGNQTSFSTVTGISFDTLFTQRRSW